MSCNLEAYGDPCTCRLTHFPRHYCSDWCQPERPYTEVDEWCRMNFRMLSTLQQKLCVDYLRFKLRDYPDMIAQWRRQHRAGMRPGSHDLTFHFGVGMAVRNLLRDVLPEYKLPQVLQRDGTHAQNWDDFYIGAIAALCEEDAA